MTIQSSVRSAWIFAAALVAAIALSIAGTGASYAAANGAAQLVAGPPADGAAGMPATTDANATSADQQATPAPSPFAGNTVAENTDTTAAAATSEPAATTVAASADDSSGWDKASIIGKIFIACGTLLTLGSAARMFMI
jgi:hypothetical protein